MINEKIVFFGTGGKLKYEKEIFKKLNIVYANNLINILHYTKRSKYNKNNWSII